MLEVVVEVRGGKRSEMEKRVRVRVSVREKEYKVLGSFLFFVIVFDFCYIFEDSFFIKCYLIIFCIVFFVFCRNFDLDNGKSYRDYM